MNKKLLVALAIFTAVIMTFKINAFSSGLEELDNPINLLTTPIPFPVLQMQSVQTNAQPTATPSPTPPPTPVPKGVTHYENFSDVVDFSSYAKMNSADIIEFPLEYDDFYYLESPNYSFTYQKKIYDYLGVEAKTAEEYAKYLVILGYTKLDDLDYQKLGDYSRQISEELLLDIDFELSSILFNNADTEFTLVLTGQSKVTCGTIVNQDCFEIRLYSLKMNQVEPKELTSFSQELRGKLRTEVPSKR